MRVADVLPAPTALFRLFVRWSTLAVVWFLAMAVALPALFLGDDGFRVLAGQTLPNDFNTLLVRQLVLHLGVTVPLMLAVLVSIAAGEVLGTPMGWSLPGARRKMLSGNLLILAVATAAIGVFASRHVAHRTTLMVVCLVPFWYAVGSSWSTLFRWSRAGLPVILITLIAIFEPNWYVTAVNAGLFGQLLVVAALALAVALLVAQAGASWGRAVVAASTTTATSGRNDHTLFASWIGPSFDRDRRVGALPVADSRHSLPQWLDAAFIESARSVRRGLLSRVMFTALFSAFLFIASGQIFLLGITIVQNGVQLSGRLPYPLSRRERARIQFAGGLLDVVVTGSIAWLAFGLLDATGVPRAFAGDLPSPLGWSVELAALIVCMPIGQWARAMGPLPATARAMTGTFLPTGLLMLSAMFLPRVLNRLLEHPPASTMLLVLAGIGIAVQLFNFVALRYVYARRDLVRAT